MPNPNQTIQSIYQQIVVILSLSDRLHLASLILNDLTQQNIAVIDSSPTWTEQDRIELITFSMQYAANLFPEDEEIVHA